MGKLRSGLVKLRPRLTYANVVSTIALLLAVSGGATAIAISAGKNTVTTKSIKPGNVTARDLGPIDVVSQVGTLSENSVDSWDSTVLRMFCPPGSRPLSGGGTGGVQEGALKASYPTPGGWQVAFGGRLSGGSIPVVGYVVCLEGSAGKPRNE